MAKGGGSVTRKLKRFQTRGLGFMQPIGGFSKPRSAANA